MRFQSQFAWYYLTGKEKLALKEARMQGRFGGGPIGHTYYGWLQESGEYPIPSGGIAKNFIARAQQAVDEQMESIMSDAMWSVGKSF